MIAHRFTKIFRLMPPFLSDLIYWNGPKHLKSFSKVRHRRCSTAWKMSQRYDVLLTLMRLRLGLLVDLVERFRVSPTLYSYISTTWLILLSKVLDKALLVWPPKESIREHLPEMFPKSGYGKCRVIIDCAAVFIDRPKSLSA